MKVDGCRVVITGGASGIGLAISRQLADRGCQIVLADIDAAALTICADERDTFHTFACDVTQQEALEALADFSWATLGGVDLVFANAGVGLPLRPLLDHTEAHARWVMEVITSGYGIPYKRLGLALSSRDLSPTLLSRVLKIVLQSLRRYWVPTTLVSTRS